jgi:mannosylglycerate hydrolase
MGIAHYDVERAAQEIRSLLRGQWRNGLVPQIVFNPKGTGYFPGPDVWQSQRSPNAPRDVQTSGITDPPVLAIAVKRIYDLAADKDWARAFLAEVFPKIVLYHNFLYDERDPDDSGLIVVVHPWESGLDNSPNYLDAGERVHLAYQPKYERLDTLHVEAKHRPTNKNYDLFVYLLEQMRAVDWDQKRYLENAPLQILDVLFNAILCRANRDLAAIAEILGEDPSQAREWEQKTAKGINTQLWDEEDGLYYEYDRVAGRLLKDNTIAGFHTLFGGVATPERARRMIEQHMLSAQEFWPHGGYPLPTTAINSPWFNAENYWLGPVWVNTNWMVLRGLPEYGRQDLATTLRDKTLELVARGGYREYFNPFTGEGYGTDSFSWTSALTIDLVESG